MLYPVSYRFLLLNLLKLRLKVSSLLRRNLLGICLRRCFLPIEIPKVLYCLPRLVRIRLRHFRIYNNNSKIVYSSKNNNSNNCSSKKVGGICYKYNSLLSRNWRFGGIWKG